MTARVRLIPLFLLLGLLVGAYLLPDDGPRPPRHPRLAARPDGGFVAGFQISPGDAGEFELVAVDADGAASGLGRYRGRLAGLAATADRVLAVTRDGTLLSLGEETETPVIGDARWNVLSLVAHGDRVLAVNYAGGALGVIEPAEGETWRETGTVAVDDQADQARLVALDGELHLLWSGLAPDLSRGAIRHRVEGGDGTWRDGTPLPFGNVDSFDAFAVGDSVLVAALTPDILDANVWPTPTAGFVRNDIWLFEPALFNERQRELFSRVREIAGAVTPEGLCWLTTGPDGALLSVRGPGMAAGREITLAPGLNGGVSWSQLSSALLFLMLIVLTVAHCRRSRAVSARFFGMPADLSSRASALLVDWLLVSLGLVFYHLAAGDLYIYMDLMTLENMNRMFWLNLGALAVYAALTESLFGATPGKMLAGLRVRSAHGGRARPLQAALRNAVRLVDMFPVVFPGVIGAVTAMFNPLRQRLGDIIAHTVVRRHAPVDSRKLILASASPRRRDLLEARGLEFRAVPADIVEEAEPGDAPEDTVRKLAEAKARAVIGEIGPERELVVGADTVVVLDGEILGKPADAADAVTMLERLSGRSHTVMTGIAVFDPATGGALSDVEHTEVEFRALTRPEIDAYVATGDPLDKAGAYGVQSGKVVKQVRGSLSNVMGLPMEKLESLFAMLDS